MFSVQWALKDQSHVCWSGRLIEAAKQMEIRMLQHFLLVKFSPSSGFYIALRFGTVISADAEWNSYNKRLLSLSYMPEKGLETNIFEIPGVKPIGFGDVDE